MVRTKDRLLVASLLGALALGMAGPPVAQAAKTTCRVRNVSHDTTGRSLKAMVAAAVDGDELTVLGSCLARFVDIDVDISIRGVGVRRTVLDARGRRKVMRIRSDAVVTLRHLVITGGVAGQYPGGGGGIRSAGTLTLIDSVVRGNSAAFGGGIRSSGPLTLTDSVVRDNHADGSGGGIYNGLEGELSLDRSAVRNNEAEAEGGGIATLGGVTLLGSLVRANSAGLDGGGIVWWDYGTITLDDSSAVTGNTPDDCWPSGC